MIFETIIGNVGVCDKGKGSSFKFEFIEEENGLFRAVIVKIPITRDCGVVSALITIIRKEKTAALSNGSRMAHNNPSLNPKCGFEKFRMPR